NTIPPPASFTFKPLAFPVNVTAGSGEATPVQLNANGENPNNPAVTTQYAIATQPANGTITDFNPATGRLTYTSTAGFTGTDTFTYTASNIGGSPSPLAGNTQTVTINVTPEPPAPPADTGTVRLVNNVLLITPKPRTDKGANTIGVGQTPDTTDPTLQRIFVSINDQIDLLQPLTTDVDRIVVYGAKASDNIAVSPDVDATLSVTLDGGQGGKNWLSAAAGPTRMHGWFGRNVLIGGTGRNQMVGQAGHVKFRPTDSTSQIFAGVPMTRGGSQNHPQGTFYRYVNGKIVPVSHYLPGTHGLLQSRNRPWRQNTSSLGNRPSGIDRD
ncbi:MAG: Ig-like domain-containing protein, partial [Isosphaeraceae bacterium]